MNGILLETHRETHSPHLYTSLNLSAERTKQSSKCEKWHLKIWPCSSIFRNSPISVRNHWHMKMPALSKEALEASSKGFAIGKEIPGQMNFLEVKRKTQGSTGQPQRKWPPCLREGGPVGQHSQM